MVTENLGVAHSFLAKVLIMTYLMCRNRRLERYGFFASRPRRHVCRFLTALSPISNRQSAPNGARAEVGLADSSWLIDVKVAGERAVEHNDAVYHFIARPRNVLDAGGG